jgi:hypothetical protein
VFSHNVFKFLFYLYCDMDFYEIFYDLETLVNKNKNKLTSLQYLDKLYNNSYNYIIKVG